MNNKSTRYLHESNGWLYFYTEAESQPGVLLFEGLLDHCQVSLSTTKFNTLALAVSHASNTDGLNSTILVSAPALSAEQLTTFDLQFNDELREAVDVALQVAELKENISYKLYDILSNGPYDRNDPTTHKAIVQLLRTELRSI